MGKRTALWTAPGPGRLILALLVAAISAAPAHADLRSAYSDYKKGDYTHAFQEFLALAKLGQPQAQFVVAEMYRDGQGTDVSDIHAYAWASLAAASGEAQGKVLAESIRPKLAPGSERIAGWLTLAYTHSALERTLLPDLSSEPAQVPHAPQAEPKAGYRLKAVKAYLAPYPTDARRKGIEGWVFVEFTVMPDGSTRFPLIIYAEPAGVFDDTVKESVLGTRFSHAPPGSRSVRTTIPYSFTLTRPDRAADGMDDTAPLGRQPGVPLRVVAAAKAGNPEAELLYGLMLDPGFGRAGGLPWLVKAAQAGLAAAQYEIARDLDGGLGCLRDEAKARRWLNLAADQGQPDAEITLADRLLHGTSSAADVTQAKTLLERDAGQGIEEGSQDAQLLLASILAATPQSALRDPQRALELLSKVDDSYGDPTPFEIRAAAQAAEGDFAHAAKSEKKAIRRAHLLRWDLSPLQARLAAYQAGKPWYGDLLDYWSAPRS